MKKSILTVTLLLVFCLLSGCASLCGTEITDTLETANINTKITIPNGYIYKALTDEDTVSYLIYKDGKDPEVELNNWDMLFTLEKSSVELFNEQINAFSKNTHLIETSNHNNNISVYILGSEASSGSANGLRLIDDEYLALIRAQKDTNEEDIVDILNSIKITLN